MAGPVRDDNFVSSSDEFVVEFRAENGPQVATKLPKHNNSAVPTPWANGPLRTKWNILPCILFIALIGSTGWYLHIRFATITSELSFKLSLFFTVTSPFDTNLNGYHECFYRHLRLVDPLRRAPRPHLLHPICHPHHTVSLDLHLFDFLFPAPVSPPLASLPHLSRFIQHCRGVYPTGSPGLPPGGDDMASDQEAR
jgi:hypothetical protein